MTSVKALGESVIRNLDQSLGKLVKTCENLLKPEISVLDPFEQSIFLTSDECKKLESKMKKTGPVCKAADLRPKVLPPYQYGYCKEKEPELPMSCPPKIRKRGRGPCCHQEVKQSKGGCRNN